MIRQLKKLLKYSINKTINFIEKPVIVLLYHRVTDLDFDPQLLSVSVNNFRAQLLYIKKNYEVFRFEDDYVKRSSPAIIITFDDGYADNYQNVLPVLEELEIPATFFIATGMIDSNREFWWDDLERLILIPEEFPTEIVLQIRGKSYTWNLSSNNTKLYDNDWNVFSKYEPSSRCQLYKDLHILLKPLSYEERNSVLSKLVKITNQKKQGRESHRVLSKSELSLLTVSELVTIGAHTHTHPQLLGLNLKEQKEEISSSKETLEKWHIRPVSVFSYPFGSKTDYDANSISICKQLKFKRVAISYPGQLHSWTYSMQIPRQIVRDWDSYKFPKKLNSFLYN